MKRKKYHILHRSQQQTVRLQQPAKGVMSWDCYIKVPNS